MGDYVLDKELRDFEKQFSMIVSATHHDSITVFDDMLTYIITAFNPEPYQNTGWRYTKEQNAMFWELMVKWLDVMKRMIDRRGWYDAFGDFFMSNVSKTSQQYRGQFFTPHHICDFMAKITLDDKDEETEATVDCRGFGRRVVVSDCCCGSARLMLAAHATSCERGHRPSYYVAEDIDRICCKMAAVNMCVHGMFGEVVCHDSLCEPDKMNVGYVINEGLYPIPVCPTIRVVTDNPMQLLAIRRGRDMLEEAARKKEPAVNAAAVEQPVRKPQAVEQLMFDFSD